ncbi:uncharacterized protein [Watersipora subatra]|uniref:uncharacterized protein n=1 Tax=Watersipora subatra TaxID=2589382 RepID=UPI00355BD98E
MVDGTTTSNLIRRDSEADEKLKYRDGSSRNKLMYFFVGFLVVVASISLTLVITYIWQGEQREINKNLLSRIEALENQEPTCACQVPEKLSDPVNTPSTLHFGMRVKKSAKRGKRQILDTVDTTDPVTVTASLREDDLIENKHIIDMHHGIASSHMALLFADPKQLNITSNEQISASSPIKFKNSTETERGCSRLMENGNKDLWCLPMFEDKQKDIFMLRDNNQHFSYFAQAPWMTSDKSQENFEVTKDTRKSLIVKKSGIYIVTSSMQFTNVKFSRVHYAVYARDRLNSHNSERLLGMCASSIDGKDVKASGALYPCSTWQLAPLNAGDQVFLKINPYIWFRVQKETFFLALIKLNNWTFDDEA